jgi:hypothetical protein
MKPDNKSVSMVNKKLEFDFNELKLSVHAIENIIGYKEGEDRGLVSGIISELLKEAQEICNIKAQFNIFNDIRFNKETQSAEIGNIRFDIGKIIFGQLKKSESIAVFICTAGEEIGLKIRKAMNEKDLLQGYIMDVIGSEIVEAAADLMQLDLADQALTSGIKITNRYSPGYCGWDVAEQHKLFRLVPDNFCGIRLNDSALMDPVKSVSGIIGIGKQVKRLPYTCKICDMKDCIYRERKYETDINPL